MFYVLHTEPGSYVTQPLPLALIPPKMTIRLHRPGWKITEISKAAWAPLRPWCKWLELKAGDKLPDGVTTLYAQTVWVMGLIP